MSERAAGVIVHETPAPSTRCSSYAQLDTWKEGLGPNAWTGDLRNAAVTSKR